MHYDLTKDNHITMTQSRLINSILDELNLNKDSVKTKDTPMCSSKILSRHPESEAFDQCFHYRRVIGMLNYLERSTRLDLSYSVHQCARFSEEPKTEHGKAIKWLGQYLKGNKDKGITLPVKNEDLVVWVDTDFVGNWEREIAMNDRDTSRSRHGYVITYLGVPISWASQLQTEIALSSTESEYIGLSTALRKVIPLMGF